MNDLAKKANIIRALSIIATSEAGSGHPTSCMSAADIAAVIFDKYFSYDLSNPKNPNNDRFILSKGHAAPLLYAVFAMAGALPYPDLLTLRKFGSIIEGHPTPRWKYAEVGTGSLGQGISVATGIALHAKRNNLTHKTYTLLGDGELMEGQVYEALNFSSLYKLDNLIVIADINGLGQTGPTMYAATTSHYEKMFESCGFEVQVIDGHNLSEVEEVVSKAHQNNSGKPFAIIAKTVKGKGVSFMENRADYHGKAVPKSEVEKALAELQISSDIVTKNDVYFQFKLPEKVNEQKVTSSDAVELSFEKGSEVATREAFGDVLATLSYTHPDVVVFDGDVGNSTFTEKFKKVASDRFIQCYIAEQQMVSAALGFSVMGNIPFVATFGAFFTRAYDQIRMAHISLGNIKFVGSHAGISIGEDGTSQMALEDMSMFNAFPDAVVLHPSDAVSTVHLVRKLAEHKGIAYLRTLRPKTKVLYDMSDSFEIGGSKVLREAKDAKVVLVAAGITVPEALKASEELAKENIEVIVIDAYSVKPIDKKTIVEKSLQASIKTVITIEDHYVDGGLGDMVLQAVANEGIKVHKLGVRSLPYSGDKNSLMDKFGISSTAITTFVKELLNAKK